MHKEELNKFVASIQQAEKEHFQVDEDAIIEAYKKDEEGQSSLAIKILAIVGGFLASLAFLAFLSITGIIELGIALIILGVILLGNAIGISRAYHKVIYTTASVAIYLIGVLLIDLGCAEFNLDVNAIMLINIGIGLLTLVTNQTLIISFISVVGISISCIVLILSNDHHSWIHLYLVGMTILFTYTMLYEAQFITTSAKLSKLYAPVRTGLLFALLFGLIAIGKKGLTDVHPDSIWISSISLFIIVLYVIHHIIKQLNIKEQKKKIAIYILSILILLASSFAPSILGALLIILLSFLVYYPTGFAIGIIALIYFVSQYYYDLNYTLLTKSIILFVSGILFLVFYLFIRKNSNSHEEV